MSEPLPLPNDYAKPPKQSKPLTQQTFLEKTLARPYAATYFPYAWDPYDHPLSIAIQPGFEPCSGGEWSTCVSFQGKSWIVFLRLGTLLLCSREPKENWVWVKIKYPKWIPSKWNHGLKPAVAWCNFDPYPTGFQPFWSPERFFATRLVDSPWPLRNSLRSREIREPTMTLDPSTRMSRSSSREVRISWYPNFLLFSILVGEPSPKKRVRKGTTGGPRCVFLEHSLFGSKKREARNTCHFEGPPPF